MGQRLLVLSGIAGDFKLFIQALRPYFSVVARISGSESLITLDEDNYTTYVDAMNPENIALQVAAGSEDIQLLSLGNISKGPYSKVIFQLLLSQEILFLNGIQEINQINPLIDLPILGDLYKNELTFIEWNNDSVNLNHLLMDSENETRATQQCKDESIMLHSVAPGKDSFLLFLLNNPAIDGNHIFEKNPPFVETDLVSNYRMKVKEAAAKGQMPEQHLTNDFTATIKERLKLFTESSFAKDLVQGIRFNEPLTLEKERLVTVYYKWLTLNYIDEPDFFKDALAVNKNKSEVRVALDRLFESLPQRHLLNMGAKVAYRNGVFFDVLMEGKSEIKIEGFTFSNKVAKMSPDFCAEVNKNATKALVKLSYTQKSTVDDTKALIRLRSLSRFVVASMDPPPSGSHVPAGLLILDNKTYRVDTIKDSMLKTADQNTSTSSTSKLINIGGESSVTWNKPDSSAAEKIIINTEPHLPVMKEVKIEASCSLS